MGAAITGALLFAFAEPLLAMVRLWDASPMYSYGYSVPLVSLYLLWATRARLAATAVAPARLAAVIVVAVAIVMATASKAGGIQVLGQLAFIVAIVGVVLGLFGFAMLRVSAPAIAYLLLMVPVWDAFTEPLHWPFQNQSASLSMSMLRTLGVPVYRDGTFLSLPGLTLEVARACSGVNYLIAVIALGLPLAYLYLESMWRRVALLIFALIIAAFANALRVTLIGVLAYLDVGSPLHGPFHILHGLFVAAVGYAALFAGLRVLREATPPARPVATRRQHAFRVPGVEAVAVTAVFLALGAGLFAKHPQEMAVDLEQLSPTFMDWEWNRVAAAPARTEWASADNQLSRQYRLPNGATADLFVGYFTAQHQNRELANSRADALHRQSRVITIEKGSSPITVNEVRLSEPAAQALFWYELDGVQTSAVRTRFQTLRNAIVRGQTNGAVVVVSSPSKLGGAAGTESELQELAARARHELNALLAKAQPVSPAAAVNP